MILISWLASQGNQLTDFEPQTRQTDAELHKSPHIITGNCNTYLVAN